MDEKEKFAYYHRLVGALTTLTAISDALNDALIFNLDEKYDPESPEFKASSEMLLSVNLLCVRQHEILSRHLAELES